MAKINRPDATLPVFATDAAADELKIFGTDTESTDLALLLTNANAIDGWASGVDGNGFPALSWFNAIGYTLSAVAAVYLQDGIALWNTNQEYYINSRAMGSDGRIYKALTGTTGLPNLGNDPVTDITNWKDELSQVYTGQKNLLINGRKLIQQRSVIGGKIQVVLNTANLGGAHTISFTGTATVTIKEATALGASDALTTWDTALVINGASGDTVTLTSNKYVHVEFSTTDFDFAQLEIGKVTTNFEYRHSELSLCQPYFQKYNINRASLNGTTVTAAYVTLQFTQEMRIAPSIVMNFTNLVNTNTFNVGDITTTGFRGTLDPISNGMSRIDFDYTANAEIFNADDGVGINYKEDRWYA